MTLDDIMQAFLRYSPPGMKGKYGLGRIKQVMRYLDDPQEKIPVIHVAGTSGKTSTSYFIRSLLEVAGQKTGLTVSPHIVGINERVQIRGNPLAPEIFIRYARDFLERIEKTELHPTYFELLIALAYNIFAKEHVDYGVIETGLGGLLDGTNVVSRADKICVITDIGLDHTEILGDTIEKIAAQKAGIIQKGNHVIMHRQTPEIMAVFEETVRQKAATMQIIENQLDTETSSLPSFQRRNWHLARAVFDYVVRRDGLKQVTETQLQKTMHDTPPGRFEIYHYQNKTIILDGAHNPQKLQALRSSLENAGVTSAAFLMNLVEAPESKIIESFRVVQPLCSHMTLPEFSAGQDLKSRRSLKVDVAFEYARKAGIPAVERCTDALHAFDLLVRRPESILVITGSLYLVSLLRPHVREIIQGKSGHSGEHLRR